MIKALIYLAFLGGAGIIAFMLGRVSGGIKPAGHRDGRTLGG
ncbi:hypothetical protein JOC37_001865 [Desulfohalotomaculum tongense]|nr:hypothetical protein [Desulforadius tongensis]MBM7855468.1 hypothetical protein [Desulforadius tongensis]